MRRAAIIRGDIYIARQQWDEAIAEFRGFGMRVGTPLAKALLGRALGLSGRHEDEAEARKILGDLIARRSRGSIGAYGPAIVHAGLGEYDQAFKLFHESVDDHSIRLEVMGPAYDRLHADPRFAGIKRALRIQNP